MTSLLLFFLLFLLSFVVLPFGVSHYEIPKVIFAELSILFLFALHLISTKNLIRVWRTKLETSIGLLKIQRIRLLRNEIENIVTLDVFFLLSFVTLLLHTFPVTFLGNSYRLQGTFLFWLLLGFAGVSSFISLKQYKPAIFLILLVVQLYLALSGVLNAEGRSVGTLGEPNALAAAVIFLWPWVLVKVKKSELQRAKIVNGLLVVAAAAVSFFIIILSGSRSGLLAFFIQIAFLISHKFISLKKATVIGIILLFIGMLLPLTDKQTIYENRGDVWKTALIAGYEHPLAGWGFGNVEVAMKEYNRRLYNNLQGYYVDSAHNFLLDMWVSGGLVGLSFLILLLFQMIKRFVADENAFLIVLLLGVITVMSFNPVSIVTLVHFWWLASHTNHL